MAEIQGRLHRRKNVGDNKSSLWSVLICFVVAVITILALGACTEPTPTVDVAQYVEATLTSVAATNEAAVTPTPTLTSTPTLTPTPASTSTPSPTPTLSIYELIPPRGEYDHNLAVTEEYDKFDDITSVTLSLTEAASESFDSMSNLLVKYQYTGNTPSIPDTIIWLVCGASDTQEFDDCSEIQFLLDDDFRIQAEDGLYDYKMLSSSVFFETVVVTLDVEDFLKIVNADRVDMRVCTEDSTLTDNQMEALRDLASRMQ